VLWDRSLGRRLRQACLPRASPRDTGVPKHQVRVPTGRRRMLCNVMHRKLHVRGAAAHMAAPLPNTLLNGNLIIQISLNLAKVKLLLICAIIK